MQRGVSLEPGREELRRLLCCKSSRTGQATTQLRPPEPSRGKQTQHLHLLERLNARCLLKHFDDLEEKTMAQYGRKKKIRENFSIKQEFWV